MVGRTCQALCALSLVVCVLGSGTLASENLPIRGRFAFGDQAAFVDGPIGVNFSITNFSAEKHCVVHLNREDPASTFSFQVEPGTHVIERLPLPPPLSRKYSPLRLGPGDTFAMTVWLNGFLRFREAGTFRLHCSASIRGYQLEAPEAEGPRTMAAVSVSTVLQLVVLRTDSHEVSCQLSSLLAEAMASEAKGEAQDAIMGIAAVPGETTADMLTKATQGDQRGVSSSAAWLLARRGEAGVRWLAEIASAKHGSTQWAAIRALGVSDVSEAEIELAKLLGNADPKTRLRAFEALAGRQGLSPTTMERMAMLQVDPDPEVSARAQEHDRRYERMAEHVRLAAEREGNPVQAQLLRDVLQRIEEEAKGDAVPRQALPSEANDGGGPAKEPPSATAKTDDNTGDAVLDSDLHPGERVQKRPHEGAGRRDGAEQAGVTEAPGTRNEPGNAWLVPGAAALLACAVCAAGAWLLLRRRAGRRTA